jgi:hypothetical protein
LIFDVTGDVMIVIRSRTLTALAGAMLLVGLGAAPAASAAPPDHWVAANGNASGGPLGINDRGDVLVDDASAWSQELVRADGVVVDLSEPPQRLSGPALYGPNNAGQVAAGYEDNFGNFVAGIFDRDGHFTALPAPAGVDTDSGVGAAAINDNGVVIGTATVAGHTRIVHWTRSGHPHLLDAGPHDFDPVAMNDHGDIAAWIDGPNGYAGRRSVVLDRQGHVLRYLKRVPGESLDEPVDINDNGIVIGQAEILQPTGGPIQYVPVRWGTLGKPHAFAAPNNATDVGVSAINDHGLVVGSFAVPSRRADYPVSKPVVWTSTTQYTVLHSLPVPPDPFSGNPRPQAAAIGALNDRNVLAGTTEEPDFGALTLWDPTDQPPSRRY